MKSETLRSKREDTVSTSKKVHQSRGQQNRKMNWESHLHTQTNMRWNNRKDDHISPSEMLTRRSAGNTAISAVGELCGDAESCFPRYRGKPPEGRRQREPHWKEGFQKTSPEDLGQFRPKQIKRGRNHQNQKHRLADKGTNVK